MPGLAGDMRGTAYGARTREGLNCRDQTLIFHVKRFCDTKLCLYHFKVATVYYLRSFLRDVTGKAFPRVEYRLAKIMPHSGW